MNKKIDRISFHFNDNCPVKCPFCYMPFDKKGSGNFADWKKIVERITDFNPSLISFAGGDPLYYKDFYKLVKEMKKNSYVNLLTSGLFLNKQLYTEISNKIDSIALPLDEIPSMGSGSSQRYSERVFTKLSLNLDFFIGVHKNIAINTLLTPINKDHLKMLAEFMLDRNLKMWNFYQFWPFEFIENQDLFSLADDEFISVIENLKSEYGDKLNIKGWLAKERVKGYFFVTSLGEVYTVAKNNSNQYVFLGSIFNSDIYEKWLEHNSEEECNEKFHQIVDREIIKIL